MVRQRGCVLSQRLQLSQRSDGCLAALARPDLVVEITTVAALPDQLRPINSCCAKPATRSAPWCRPSSARAPLRPAQTSAVRRQAACRSGTNPDNRNRNRDAQTKCAENRRNEFGEQASVV